MDEIANTLKSVTNKHEYIAYSLFAEKQESDKLQL